MSAKEYGIFTDEGCIESGLWDEEAALTVARKYLDDGEPVAEVFRICPDHEEQPLHACEDCAGWVDE